MSNVKKLDTGLILNGNRKIAYDNGTSIYIETSARNNFADADHVAFDALVYATQKPKIYVGSLKTQFDWKTQFDNFMKGQFPEGIEFSQEETKVLQTLEDIKTKIKAAFALPTIPYTPIEGFETPKVFRNATDEEIAQFTEWLSGKGNSPQPPRALRNHGVFLRLHTTKGGSRFIYNSNTDGYAQYRIGVKTFTKFFNDTLKPRWAGEASGTYGPSINGYSTRIYETTVDIGCQRSIPRSEIERIAKQLGLI